MIFGVQVSPPAANCTAEPFALWRSVDRGFWDAHWAWSLIGVAPQYLVRAHVSPDGLASTRAAALNPVQLPKGHSFLHLAVHQSADQLIRTVGPFPK